MTPPLTPPSPQFPPLTPGTEEIRTAAALEARIVAAAEANETNVSLVLAAGAYLLLDQEIVISRISLTLSNRVDGVTATLDARRRGRIFKLVDAGVLVLRGLALTGGRIDEADGAGILVTGAGSQLHAENVEITNCTSDGGSGGGITADAGGMAQLRDIVVAGCSSSTYGGGIYCGVRTRTLCMLSASAS